MPEIIGYICFHNDDGQYDLGYCFHSDYQGKGYAYEGCLLVMKYMKQYGGNDIMFEGGNFVYKGTDF